MERRGNGKKFAGGVIARSAATKQSRLFLAACPTGLLRLRLAMTARNPTTSHQLAEQVTPFPVVCLD
jgi:hypothetical protein